MGYNQAHAMTYVLINKCRHIYIYIYKNQKLNEEISVIIIL